MTTTTPQTLLAGLCFPEGPRWHDNALWFSDIYAQKVIRLDPATGATEVMAEVPGGPSGLGFLPDGRLLIASGHDRTVYRREADGALSVHADLSALATWHVNDMFVDHLGRAYVGNYGDDSAPPAAPRPADLILVEPDGAARVVADEMMFANGIAATADRATLVVAETRAAPGRLTTFRVAADGSLSERATLREFEPVVFPDGIAIDAADNIWVASPFSDEVIQVAPDGQILRRLPVASPYAVAVGGAHGEHLYVCCSDDWQPEKALAAKTGRIMRIDLG